MNIKGFDLINADKFERALNGTPRDDGSIAGGIAQGNYGIKETPYLEDRENEAGEVVKAWLVAGQELDEEESNKVDSAILAEYDKLGGLIKRGDDKVKTGSFWNFKARKPHETPVIVFTYKVNGKFVDVNEGTELPGIIKATKQLEEAQNEKIEVKKLKRIKKAKVEEAE